MKALFPALLACSLAAWAQTNPPAGETQQERLKRMAQQAAAADAASAPPAKLSDIPDDSVVGVCDGVSLTMGVFKKIISSSDQLRQSALSDPPAAVRWWCGMQELARQAVGDKLDQQSPTREQLEILRVFTLGQAEMNLKLNTENVDHSAIEKYYADHKELYKQVRVKAIYIAFGDSAGNQSRSEAQAKEKAAALRAQIRTGADFARLVKDNSDDVTSREKDGEFGVFNRKQNIPDDIARTVFALQPGEVSEPVRQPGGYYLLRAEEVTYIPLAQVETDILMTLRQEMYNLWLKAITDGAKVQYPNPNFQPKAQPK